MQLYTMRLSFWNEKQSSIKLILEPLCEFFTIQAGQKIEVHAIFEGNTKNHHFTIEQSESCVVIYAPGEIAGFIDCYATLDGVRLKADEDQAL